LAGCLQSLSGARLKVNNFIPFKFKGASVFQGIPYFQLYRWMELLLWILLKGHSTSIGLHTLLMACLIK